MPTHKRSQLDDLGYLHDAHQSIAETLAAGGNENDHLDEAAAILDDLLEKGWQLTPPDGSANNRYVQHLVEGLLHQTELGVTIWKRSLVGGYLGISTQDYQGGYVIDDNKIIEVTNRSGAVTERINVSDRGTEINELFSNLLRVVNTVATSWDLGESAEHKARPPRRSILRFLHIR